VDERAAAAHIVFKQAALAFVQAGGCAARQDGIIILGVNVQLIQGMAALVRHAVQVGEHILRHIMGGNAHIAVPEGWTAMNTV